MMWAWPGFTVCWTVLKRSSPAGALWFLAGMDGVLPSVIGGLASCPVIAVPTSIGYGANFNGIAPLLTMLNSCAPERFRGQC